MADYQKRVFTGGTWLDKEKVSTGMRATIATETNPEPSKFKNKDGSVKMQDVCQIKLEGFNGLSKFSLNNATLNALIDAFGTKSTDWVGKILTITKQKKDGKMFVYLVPEGFVCGQDDEGFTVVARKGMSTPMSPVLNREVNDIPVIEEERDEVLPF